MAEETQGVTAEDSPASEATSAVPEQSAAPTSVNVGPGDRPIENLKGEFDRKFGKVQQTLDQVVQYLALQAQQQTRPPQSVSKELTNDELWVMAQQGDRSAFEEYQRRIARQAWARLSGDE